MVHYKGCAALAGLAVDADNRFVLPAQVCGVNGQIGHLPVGRLLLFHKVHALVDGVLVGAGKSGEHQLPGIGVAWVDL